MIMIFPQVCLACVTHAAPYPGHKIYTLACDHKYRYRYVYTPLLHNQNLETSLTYWRLMMRDQPPLIVDHQYVAKWKNS